MSRRVSRAGLAALLVGACTTQAPQGSFEDEPAAAQPVAAPSVASTNPLAAKMIMPVQHGDAPAAPFAAQNKLHYYGGRVLSKVQVVQVLWGTGVRSDLVSGLPDFYKAIVQSAYFDWLGEYDTISVPAAVRLGMGTTQESEQKIGRGSYLSQVAITPSISSTTITDAQIMQELTKQIDSGVLPPPIDDGKGGYRTIYMIDFPSGIRINDPTGNQSCVQFCAYHGAGVYKGKNLAYGVHPDISQSGCAGGCGASASNIANAGSVHSHELIEAVTDPDIGILIISGGQQLDFPVAWYSETGGGEIGDICNAQQGQIAGVTVQTEWSNSQGACITEVPGLPTCIDNKPGACSACTADTQCAAPTGICAPASDDKAGSCVACTANAQCSGVTPTCDKSTTDKSDTCRACAVNADCAAPTGVCVTAATATAPLGSCVQCLANTDCSKDTPKCDLKTNTCKPDDSGCSVTGTFQLEGGGLGIFGGTLFGLALILRRRRR